MSTTQPPTTPPSPPADEEDPYQRPLLGPNTPRNPHPRRCNAMSAEEIAAAKARWDALPQAERDRIEGEAKARMQVQLDERKRRLGY